MKKIILSICVIALMFSSCSDDFLNVKPTSKMVADDVVTSDLAIKAVREGMYSQLVYSGSNNSPLYTLLHPILGDILGEDMVYGNQWWGTANAEYSYKSTENSGIAYQMWYRTYYDIEVTNNILNLDFSKIEGMKESIFNKYKAEAYAMRAMLHYDLAKYFVRSYELDKDNACIPYVDKIQYTTTPGKVTLPSRDLTSVVYEKAIADLNQAITLFGAELSETKYFTKEAAHAVLARIYMDMAGSSKSFPATGDEKKFLDLAKSNAKLANAKATLMSSESYLYGGLSKFNSESILTFGIDENKMSKWRVFHSFHDTYDGMGDDFLVDGTLVKDFYYATDINEKPAVGEKIELDLRRMFFLSEYKKPSKATDHFEAKTKYYYVTLMPKELSSSSIKKVYFASEELSKSSKGYTAYGKFPRQDLVLGSKRGSLALGDYTYIRSSEMILTIAECEVRLGNDVAARTELEKVAARMYWGAKFIVDPADVAKVKEVPYTMAENRAIYTSKVNPDAKSKNDLLELILKERRKELFGEGHRIRDIKRLGKGFARKDRKTQFGGDVVTKTNQVIKITKFVDDAKFAWPIPRNEKNSNPNLK